MKLQTIVLVSTLALAGCNTSDASKQGERPATKAEIEKIAVGRTVSNAMFYGADGSYNYKGGSPGKYRISEGSICVNFDDGKSRCDKIVTDGSGYFLINSRGQRFPFG
ncbi:hypothetical protein [Methylobrevis albus]|uniref:Lipoprotein n=1 Tax=Methylobrevis albus TaxID=2793297 RepID=A0A931HYW0_9HYPH|nr:hypothetical protein [Methylobrevis albus]MBH0236592.1 hypothetical protein [Methylobrevis albus]